MSISFHSSFHNMNVSLENKIYKELIPFCEKKQICIGSKGNQMSFEFYDTEEYCKLRDGRKLFNLEIVENCQKIIKSTIQTCPGKDLTSFNINPSKNLQTILEIKLKEKNISQKPTEGECIIAMLLEGFEAQFFEISEEDENFSQHCSFKAKIVTKD